MSQQMKRVEAMDMAHHKMETITARHLYLSSRVVGFPFSAIAYFRERVGMHIFNEHKRGEMNWIVQNSKASVTRNGLFWIEIVL